MRFLSVTIHSGGHGAYERQRRIARALMDAGHEVLWVAPGLAHPSGEQLLSVASRHSFLPGVLGWMFCLRAAFRKYRPQLDRIDAIFTVREYDALACLLDARLRVHPHVFFMRGDTVACERYLMHNALSWRARFRSFVTCTIYPPIQGFVFPRLERIVVVAQFIADTILHRIPRAAPVSVLANDSEALGRLEQPDPRQEAAIRALKSPGNFVVGVVGQIFWRAKGFDLFLAAMRQLKDRSNIRAAILGYGSEEAAVPQHIEAYGLSEQASFLGRSASANRLMPLFDLIVVPTRFMDANPNVVLEALEAGCCILASDIEAHRAQLVYPELLFPNGDEVELARAIVALSESETLCVRNRALARERREAFHFNWNSAVVSILEAAASGSNGASTAKPPVEEVSVG